MKVLRITNSLDYGGIEKVFELHAKYHRRDYELVLVALGHGGKAEETIRKFGYRVIVLNTTAKIPSWESYKALVGLFRIEKPDVVHTCGAEANFHGLIAAFFGGVPRRVGEEIGIPGRTTLAKLVFRIVFALAHRVVAISNAVRVYLTHLEVPVAKVHVVYNPINSVLNRPVHVSKRDSFIISFVGRLEPIKNVAILVDLLRKLKDRYPTRLFELWLIGAGSQQEFLLKYANHSGVGSWVRFIGFVDEPGDFLVQTDVFVLPSFFEGFGLACVEAIQHGLPVIVSNSGGMGEYIIDGSNGFLFNPHSLGELFQKTELLLNMDQDKLQDMTSKAMATINEKFSPDRYIRELNQIYFPVHGNHFID